MQSPKRKITCECDLASLSTRQFEIDARFEKILSSKEAEVTGRGLAIFAMKNRTELLYTSHSVRAGPMFWIDRGDATI